MNENASNDIIALPKISIITPSFNQGQFLEKTIQSVLSQNYPNLEYIIIDGNSTDNSIEIIRKYQSDIAICLSEKDNGTYEANNKGLKLLTGEYWCILNSDDYLLPNAIWNIVEKIRKIPNAPWLCGGEHIVDENNNLITKRLPQRPTEVAGFTFLNGCWISHPAVFLKKEVIDVVGYFRKTHMMDTDYWLQMEKAGFSPTILDCYLAGYRIHNNAKSANKIKIQNEFIRVFKNFTQENSIQNVSSVKSKLKDHIVELYTFLLWRELVDKNRLAALKLTVQIFLKKPSVLFGGWYLGLIKRIFIGVSKNDPIYKHYKNFESAANWTI